MHELVSIKQVNRAMQIELHIPVKLKVNLCLQKVQDQKNGSQLGWPWIILLLKYERIKESGSPFSAG